jgi:autotransporter family porin
MSRSLRTLVPGSVRRAALVCVLVLAAILPLAPAAQAATFSIACGDIAGLIAAITIANTNSQPDTIELAAGCTYQVSVPDNGVNAFPQILLDASAANTLTINGNGATIERGAAAGSMRFFEVAGGGDRPTLTLSDLTLRNGSLTGFDEGGAVLANNAILVLSGVTFTNNTAAEGGAVNSYFSQVAISGSVFLNNTAGSGGALFSFYSLIEIGDSSFSANSATDPFGRGGGAIYALSPGGSITGSTFSGNTSAETGGAITFGNDGGGELEILNSTISGNQAADSGGGIRNDIALSLNSATVTANIADSDGDGKGDGGGASIDFSGSVGLNSSIIAGNFDTPGNGGLGALYPDVDSGPGSSGYNLIGSVGAADFALNTVGDRYGDPSATTTPDPGAFESATPIDPLLAALADNGGPTATHALLAGSPAIDNADIQNCPPTDQRGVARPAAAGCDIGAYEGAVAPLAPEIVLLDEADNPIANGAATVDFGSTPAGAAVTRTFTIQNTGTAPLALSNLSLPAGFSLVGSFPASIAAGGSATFQVRLDAGAAGTYGGALSFGNTDSDENPFTFQITGVVTQAPPAAAFNAFLPLVVAQGQADLVITSITLSPRKLSYQAGEPVEITVIVTNQGSAPATPFWVDLYVNPVRAPAINDLWHDVCGITPCVGVAWSVTRNLAPGESITLTTTAGYDSSRTYWLGWLPSGTTTLYALADSWNTAGTTGAVLESDETNNRAQVAGLTVAGSNPPYAPWQPAGYGPQPHGAPARPLP